MLWLIVVIVCWWLIGLVVSGLTLRSGHEQGNDIVVGHLIIGFFLSILGPLIFIVLDWKVLKTADWKMLKNIKKQIIMVWEIPVIPGKNNDI